MLGEPSEPVSSCELLAAVSSIWSVAIVLSKDLTTIKFRETRHQTNPNLKKINKTLAKAKKKRRSNQQQENLLLTVLLHGSSQLLPLHPYLVQASIDIQKHSKIKENSCQVLNSHRRDKLTLLVTQSSDTTWSSCSCRRCEMISPFESATDQNLPYPEPQIT